jgi:hypothetical protein
MLRRLFLHIGVEKTGKKTLQLGMDHLSVRTFEPRQMHDGDLLADFSFAVGFEQHKLLQRPPNQNQSLDVRSLEFLRRFNLNVPFLVDGQPNASRRPIAEAITAVSTSERLIPSAEAATAFFECGGRA